MAEERINKPTKKTFVVSFRTDRPDTEYGERMVRAMCSPPCHPKPVVPPATERKPSSPR